MDYVCITLEEYNTDGGTFFGSWVAQTGIQNMFG